MKTGGMAEPVYTMTHTPTLQSSFQFKLSAATQVNMIGDVSIHSMVGQAFEGDSGKHWYGICL